MNTKNNPSETCPASGGSGEICMRGISRIDSGSTHGWFVRGYRNGKTYSKLFSDLKLGGKDKALAKAATYRDDLHARLAAIPTKSRKRRRSKNRLPKEAALPAAPVAPQE